MAIGVPSGISITNRTPNSITFEWTMATDSTKTLIRYKDYEAPTSETDGELGYHGTGTTATIKYLQSNKKYHFSFWGTTESYSLSGVTDTDTTGMIPLGLAFDHKYIYLTGATGPIKRYNRSDLSLESTYGPSGATQGERIDVKGRYMAYIYSANGFLYDLSTDTLILAMTATSAPGADSLRAVHIDTEEEYVYFGNVDGTIYYYDIATLTENTYQPHTDYVRSIDTSGDMLVSGSNDNTVALYDRSTRTSPTFVKNDFTGITSTVEVTRFLNYYLVVGSDAGNGTVYWFNTTTPYAQVDLKTEPTDDITSISWANGYWLVGSDDTQAYLYSGTPGAITLDQTFNEAGNSYVEDCCICDNGDLYFCMGQSGSIEKLYSYDYLSFTYGATKADVVALPDSQVIEPFYKSQKMLLNIDFGNPHNWKNESVVNVGGQETSDGLVFSGGTQQCYCKMFERFKHVDQVTMVYKFTPEFAYTEDAFRYLLDTTSSRLTLIKYNNASSNKLRFYMGGV